MDDRGRMLVLFFFLVSLVSTTMMTQSAEPCIFKLLCQRNMSSFTEVLYTSVSYNEAVHLFRHNKDRMTEKYKDRKKIHFNRLQSLKIMFPNKNYSVK